MRWLYDAMMQFWAWMTAPSYQDRIYEQLLDSEAEGRKRRAELIVAKRRAEKAEAKARRERDYQDAFKANFLSAYMVQRVSSYAKTHGTGPTLTEISLFAEEAEALLSTTLASLNRTRTTPPPATEGKELPDA